MSKKYDSISDEEYDYMLQTQARKLPENLQALTDAVAQKRADIAKSQQQRKVDEKAVKCRPISAEYVPFIFKSWLKSFRTSRSIVGVPDSIYYQEHHKVIEHCLLKADTIVLTSATDDTLIYGFLVYEIIDRIFVVHYAYIKQSFRQCGMLDFMLKHAGCDRKKPIVYTHHTTIVPELESKFTLVLNPYLR